MLKRLQAQIIPTDQFTFAHARRVSLQLMEDAHKEGLPEVVAILGQVARMTGYESKAIGGKFANECYGEAINVIINKTLEA